MPLVLTIHSETALEQKSLFLRSGQVARVGSGEWVEWSLPFDDQLAEVHFRVRCDGQTCIETISNDVSLEFNGESVHDIRLASTDGTQTLFGAGNTEFAVQWFPDLVATSAPPPPSGQPQTTKFPTALDRDRHQKMKLSKGSLKLLCDASSPIDFLDRLIADENLDDASRWLAINLAPTERIRWAITASRLSESASKDLWDLVTAWIQTGSESDREAVAECSKHLAHEQVEIDPVLRSIVSSIVAAGGSLAPPDQPIIAPPEQVAAFAVFTAFRWSCARAKDRPTTRMRWIEAGRCHLKTSVPAMEASPETSDDAKEASWHPQHD